MVPKDADGALLDALRDRDVLERLLADEVTFHSPVRTYRDRDDVIHLLTTIGGLLEDVRPTRERSGPDGAATFVSARVGDDELEGVLDEIHDADDRVVEVTLMLRPLQPMLNAI